MVKVPGFGAGCPQGTDSSQITISPSVSSQIVPRMCAYSISRSRSRSFCGSRRRVSSSRSIRSLFRGDVALLATREFNPINGICNPETLTRMRSLRHRSNEIPSIPVRIWILIGSRPISTTMSGSRKSSGFRLSEANPNSPKAPTNRSAFSRLIATCFNFRYDLSGSRQLSVSVFCWLGEGEMSLARRHALRPIELGSAPAAHVRLAHQMIDVKTTRPFMSAGCRFPKNRPVRPIGSAFSVGSA